ncbi:metallophosphoesterase [uncultured Cohaesibacter sp.]|uniref:metallophosphoesterase n=1 Tax=uncultured Cohaesibacter sp. TaxID=1002546 RepID=UPI0029C6640C|nr:metallophosphoesterase [uncultured Cohaesibacter sp.]
MLIAQISDTHVGFQGEASLEALRALMQSIAAQPVKPDLVLFSGDLTERAEDREYDFVASCLSSFDIPVLAIPGNHDARAPMKTSLGALVGEIPSGHLCVCNDRFPLVVLGLDTLTEGAPHGELCSERLQWLSGKLDQFSDRDVLIFMHHPPFRTGLRHMDSMGLREGQTELSRLIETHGRVQAILCGHVHRPIFGICGSVPVRVAPSAFQQIAFDLRENEPYRFTDEPPGYMMHLYDPEVGFVSHVVPVKA